MSKLLIVYGTRPEYIKIHPLVEALRETDIDFDVLRVTQHEDIIDFNPSDPTFRISPDIAPNRLDCIFASITSQSSFLEPYSHILVQGDTATACAVALCAFNARKKVIHLEAGLRTYNVDHPYPEEVYRRMISSMTAIHLCPTKDNEFNLLMESVAGQYFVVGNTVLDNLIGMGATRDKASYGNKILVTMHRRENHKLMSDWFARISNLAKKYPRYEFILPLHPNPEVSKHKDLLKGVNVVAPMSHKKIVDLLLECKMCISDSGGIQEEASFLGKKVIVCRYFTERTEGIGTFFHMCWTPTELPKLFGQVIKNCEIDEPCPFGDGNSAQKIVKLLKKEL